MTDGGALTRQPGADPLIAPTERARVDGGSTPWDSRRCAARQAATSPNSAGRKQQMRRQARGSLVAVLGVGLAVTLSLAPAAARTTGRESFKGTLVKTAPSGTSSIVSTVVGARGVFKGLGRIAEVES